MAENRKGIKQDKDGLSCDDISFHKKKIKNRHSDTDSAKEGPVRADKNTWGKGMGIPKSKKKNWEKDKTRRWTGPQKRFVKQEASPYQEKTETGRGRGSQHSVWKRKVCQPQVREHLQPPKRGDPASSRSSGISTKKTEQDGTRKLLEAA